MNSNHQNNNLFSGILRIHGKDFTRLQKFLDFIFIFTLFNIVVVPGIPSKDIATSSILALLIFLFFFVESSEIYKSFRKNNIFYIFRKIIQSWFYFSTSFLILAYLTYTSSFFPRSRIIVWILSLLIVLINDHLILRMILRKYRSKGGNSRTIIFLGNYFGISKFEQEISANKWMGYKVVAWFSTNIKKDLVQKTNTPYMGGKKEMREWLLENHTDEIVFSDSPYNDQNEFNELIHFLGDFSIPIRYAPSWGAPSMGFQTEYIGEQVLINLWASRLSYLDKKLKRVFDIFFSILILFITLPILVSTMILIKLTSSGRIFYLQERNGLNGKKFKIYKFRTMTVNDKGDDEALKQTTRNDPRVTQLGRILRKWSIDELPQIFNVLSGDMSIVGPRPHAIIHNQIYRKKISGYMQRNGFKPGITGLAQIEGWRGETKEDELMKKRISADLRYMNNWNIFFDFKILFYTLFKIKSKKAY